MERYSIFGLIFSAIILLSDLHLLKKRKISGSTFTRWFIIGLALGIVSLVPAFFALLYIVLGTQILISAVTVTAFMVLLLLIFYLDYQINELSDKVMKLTAKVSYISYNLKVNRNKKKDDGNKS